MLLEVTKEATSMVRDFYFGGDYFCTAVFLVFWICVKFSNRCIH